MPGQDLRKIRQQDSWFSRSPQAQGLCRGPGDVAHRTGSCRLPLQRVVMDQQVLSILDRVHVELDDLRAALHDLAQRGQAVGRMGAGPREQTVVLEQIAAY